MSLSPNAEFASDLAAELGWDEASFEEYEAFVAGASSAYVRLATGDELVSDQPNKPGERDE